MKILREDLMLASKFEANGWTIDFNVVDKDHNRIQTTGPDYPHSALIFKKGDTVIWSCISGWACAEFDGSTYKNHRYHKDLEIAFNIEN